MNLFVVFICITVGTMTGLFFSKRSAARARYFAGLVDLTDELRRNLMFRKDKLVVFLSAAKPNEKLLAKHIDGFCRHVNEGGADFLCKGYLKNNELAVVQKFFLGLGAGDATTELEALQSHKDNFASIYAKVKASNDRIGAAYTKLGFLAGLAVGILFI